MTLLMTEYGREEYVRISVNGVSLGLDDLPGERFQADENLLESGTVILNFIVSDGTKSLKQAGIALRVGGKIVGKPGLFGLEDAPEIPPKLLKKLYGEVEADGLSERVTADWGDIVENSKAFQALKPVVHSHLKNAVEEVYKREVRKNVHGVIERNLWVLGYDHSLISSNKTLARTIQEYTSPKFTGDRASKSPDLFLAQNLRSGFLLIGFKRPSKPIDRADKTQAQEYRDDLEKNFGDIQILLLGKERDVGAAAKNDPPNLEVFGYETLISTARTRNSTGCWQNCLTPNLINSHALRTTH